MVMGKKTRKRTKKEVRKAIRRNKIYCISVLLYSQCHIRFYLAFILYFSGFRFYFDANSRAKDQSLHYIALGGNSNLLAKKALALYS